jgi:nucleoside-diphosphate-sugar epimerase
MAHRFPLRASFSTPRIVFHPAHRFPPRAPVSAARASFSIPRTGFRFPPRASFPQTRGAEMKLLVFGGSGRFGGSLVRQALAEGQEVTAGVRRTPAVPLRHERLDVVRVDVLSESGLEEVVTGKEAVVFAVGRSDRKTTLVCSDGVHNVVQAMRAAGVRRLVCLSSTVVETPEHGVGYRLWTRLVTEKVRRNPLLDLARMEDEVAGASLDWTVVRVPTLTWRPPVTACRAAVNARLARPRPIGYDEAARYVLHHLDDPTTYRATVEIGG